MGRRGAEGRRRGRAGAPLPVLLEAKHSTKTLSVLWRNVHVTHRMFNTGAMRIKFIPMQTGDASTPPPGPLLLKSFQEP